MSLSRHTLHSVPLSPSEYASTSSGKAASASTLPKSTFVRYYRFVLDIIRLSTGNKMLRIYTHPVIFSMNIEQLYKKKNSRNTGH